MASNTSINDYTQLQPKVIREWIAKADKQMRTNRCRVSINPNTYCVHGFCATYTFGSEAFSKCLYGGFDFPLNETTDFDMPQPRLHRYKYFRRIFKWP